MFEDFAAAFLRDIGDLSLSVQEVNKKHAAHPFFYAPDWRFDVPEAKQSKLRKRKRASGEKSRTDYVTSWYGKYT